MAMLSVMIMLPHGMDVPPMMIRIMRTRLVMMVSVRFDRFVPNGAESGHLSNIKRLYLTTTSVNSVSRGVIPHRDPWTALDEYLKFPGVWHTSRYCGSST
jgi:hypothetical protein